MVLIIRLLQDFTAHVDTPLQKVKKKEYFPKLIMFFWYFLIFPGQGLYEK